MADIKDSLNLDNIQESTILAIYDDIMDLADFDARDIIEFFILRLMTRYSRIGHVLTMTGI
jgi:hypothetical protein